MHKRHQDDIRAKIQSDRLIQWLNAGIMGQEFQGKPVALTTEKVNAVKILLNKSLPDLKSMEIVGNKDQPLEHTLTVKFIASS